MNHAGRNLPTLVTSICLRSEKYQSGWAPPWASQFCGSVAALASRASSTLTRGAAAASATCSPSQSAQQSGNLFFMGRPLEPRDNPTIRQSVELINKNQPG